MELSYSLKHMLVTMIQSQVLLSKSNKELLLPLPSKPLKSVAHWEGVKEDPRSRKKTENGRPLILEEKELTKRRKRKIMEAKFLERLKGVDTKEGNTANRFPKREEKKVRRVNAEVAKANREEGVITTGITHKRECTKSSQKNKRPYMTSRANNRRRKL